MAEAIAEPAPPPAAPAAPAPGTPAARKSIADKFRAAMVEPGAPAAPASPAAPAAPAPPSKPAAPSPVDIAIGDVKPEPKPVEDDFDKIEKPGTDDWSKLREVYKRTKTEFEALKSKAPAPEISSQLTESQKKIDELTRTISERDEAIKAINAEYSVDHIQLVTRRDDAINDAVGKMEMFSSKEKADTLLNALALPEGKFRRAAIKEALQELDTAEQAEMVNDINAINRVEKEIHDFRRDLPKKWDEIQKRDFQSQREQSEKAIRELKSNFDAIIKDLPTASPFLRQIAEDADGATKWNGDIRTEIDSAYKILDPNGGATLKESVETLAMGRAFPRVAAYALELRKQLNAANARLAEFDGAGPDIKPSPRKPGATGEKRLTPAEKYHKAMAAGEYTEE